MGWWRLFKTVGSHLANRTSRIGSRRVISLAVDSLEERWLPSGTNLVAAASTGAAAPVVVQVGPLNLEQSSAPSRVAGSLDGPLPIAVSPTGVQLVGAAPLSQLLRLQGAEVVARLESSRNHGYRRTVSEWVASESVSPRTPNQVHQVSAAVIARGESPESVADSSLAITAAATVESHVIRTSNFALDVGVHSVGAAMAEFAATLTAAGPEDIVERDGAPLDSPARATMLGPLFGAFLPTDLNSLEHGMQQLLQQLDLLISAEPPQVVPWIPVHILEVATAVLCAGIYIRCRLARRSAPNRFNANTTDALSQWSESWIEESA